MEINLSVTTNGSASTENITMNGITFTVTEVLSNGIDATGRAWAVVDTGSQITAITGADGAMLDPERTTNFTPDQGYDDRMANYSAGLNDTANLPLSVSTGNIIVATSKAGSVSRDGSFDACGCIHFVSASAAGKVLPASIGHAGRTVPAAWSVDFDAWYAARSVLTKPVAATMPPFADLLACMATYSPTIAQIPNANGSAGYEGFSVTGRGAGSSYTNKNYGRYLGAIEDIALLALYSDVYTEAQVKELAAAVVMQGVELGCPLVDSPQGRGPDGGHFQFWQGSYILAMSLTGQAANIDTFMANGGDGNWSQTFKWTTPLLAELDPHSTTTSPGMSRQRTLGAQPGGSVLRIPVEGTSTAGDDDEATIPAGMIFTDGTSTATVAAEVTMPNTPTAGTTLDVTLTGANPFVATDVVYGQAPSGWATLGDFDWNLRGTDQRFGRFWLAGGAIYRDLQSNAGKVLALHAQGLLDAVSHEAVIGYCARAMEANNPTSANDYPGMAQTVDIAGTTYNVADDYWADHWATVSAVTQRNG